MRISIIRPPTTLFKRVSSTLTFTRLPGFLFAPQYDLLDPLTGRSIRNPRTNVGLSRPASLFQLPLSSNSGLFGQSRERPQRQIKKEDSSFLLPMAKHRDYEEEVNTALMVSMNGGKVGR